jgi:hypothetical protein
MTKAWCIWHETGELPKHGYYWICPECFFKITSTQMSIESVGEYLRGERPRIMKNGDKESRDTVEKFLVDIADFDRRSRNTWRLIKSVTQGTPIEPLEQTNLEADRDV